MRLILSRLAAVGLAMLMCATVVPVRVLGDEGMFLPDAVNRVTWDKLKKRGLKIPFTESYNPNGVSLTVCTDFTVAAGKTKTFSIDNSPPPGGFALTIGYWKNWASCAKSSGNHKPVLDQTLAAAEPNSIPVGLLTLHGSTTTPNVAPGCQAAVNLLNKSTVTKGTGASSSAEAISSSSASGRCQAVSSCLARRKYSCMSMSR